MIDSDFEDQVLARSLRDPVYLKKSVRILEAHHFSTEQHAWIWSSIKYVWDNYKECCSGKLLEERLKREKKKDEREPFVTLARKLFRLKPDTPTAALEELSLHVRLVNAQLAIEKAAKALEKGDAEAVYEIARALGRQELKGSSIGNDGDWFEGFEARQAERKYRREHPEEFISIPTGYRKLDTIVGGGVQYGELALILGSTGRGKSIFLTNIAFNAACRGHDTVYFAFEMPKRQIDARLDTRWAGLDYKKYKEFDFTRDELIELEKKYNKDKRRFDKKLRTIEYPVRTADMNTIVGKLDELADDGFVPKCVIFDSLDHLRPIGRGESTRLDQAEIYWRAKGLAEERGCAVWSSTQIAKEFVNKIATAESASESYDKGRIADLMLSINEPNKKTRATKPADDDDGEWDEAGGISPEVIARGRILDLYIAKFRDGESKITIPLDADFSKMLMAELGEERGI